MFWELRLKSIEIFPGSYIVIASSIFNFLSGIVKKVAIRSIIYYVYNGGLVQNSNFMRCNHSYCIGKINSLFC